MRWTMNDGGRAAAGFTGKRVGDCVARAIAIATETPYVKVYNELNRLSEAHERRGKRKRGVSSARNGVYRSTYDRYLKAKGWTWVPTMAIGSGCRVHLREDELPKGRIIVALSRHMSAVIDGVVHDLYDPSRSGTRCVYGYYYKENR